MKNELKENISLNEEENIFTTNIDEKLIIQNDGFNDSDTNHENDEHFFDDLDNEFGKENQNEYEKLKKSEIRKKKRQANSDIVLSEEIVNEKIRQALESQNPKKRRRTTIWSLILLLLNIIFMTIIIKNLVSDVEDFSFSTLISSQGNKLLWFAVGILVYILFIFVQVVMYKIMIKSFTDKKSWKVAYDVAVIGKYYDNVTPFAVGGQPMQIISLAKNGVSAGVSTSIPLIKMIINTVMTAFLSLLFFAIGLPLISATTPLNQILITLLEILGIIGLIITVLVAIFMFLLSSGTLFTRSFIRGIIRFLYKIKLVKNYRQTYRKTLNQVAEYKFSMKYLWNNKKLLFSLLGLNLVEIVCSSIFSFIVVMALATNIDDNILLFMFVCMTKYYLCQMASSYIPLPGGTGMMEIAYIILFGVILGDNTVWGLLGWRFLSYYIIIIHGFIHELIKIIKNFIDTKKIKNQSNNGDLNANNEVANVKIAETIDQKQESNINLEKNSIDINEN